MKHMIRLGMILWLCASLAIAQRNADGAAVTVPHLIKFSGTAHDANGGPLRGMQGTTFTLYEHEEGGSGLWMETQNVDADKNGHFTVSLGATKPDGIPPDILTSGEARWLSIRISGQSEQARILLQSVPYALKAQDAETLGGMPASAFLQMAPEKEPGLRAQQLPPTVHGNGTASYLPLWTTMNIIDKSSLFPAGMNVGVGTMWGEIQ